jgi:hypothetical protein
MKLKLVTLDEAPMMFEKFDKRGDTTEVVIKM